MIRNVLTLLFFACFATCFNSALGQYYYYNDKYFDNDLVFELGGSIGIMNSITDLGGQSSNKKIYFNEINWQNKNTAAGFYVGAMFQQIVGVRLEATYGSIKGNDSLLPNTSSRRLRNLSFRSDIREIGLIAEFHPLNLGNREQPLMFSPYIMAGAGWFSFNPQGNLDGKWVDLKPLRTEGQGFTEYPDRTPYRLSQANLCAGMGIRYDVNSSFNIRLEWLHRYLFTDYLDDASTQYINPDLFSSYLSPSLAQQAKLLHKRIPVSSVTRGNPKSNDSYFTINLKAGITLGRTRR
jgi:hypothetical protein